MIEKIINTLSACPNAKERLRKYLTDDLVRSAKEADTKNSNKFFKSYIKMYEENMIEDTMLLAIVRSSPDKLYEFFDKNDLVYTTEYIAKNKFRMHINGKAEGAVTFTSRKEVNYNAIIFLMNTYEKTFD